MSAIPLYRRVKERIRAEILAGHGEEGGRLPTERELQARYGVSRPTISKALAELAAEGHLVRTQRQGSFAAGTSGAGGTKALSAPALIGYVAPLSGEELVQRAFRGIDRLAKRRDYRVLMGNAGYEVGGEQAAVRDLIASGVRGLLITPCLRTRDDLQRDYLITEPPGLPLVLMDICLPEQGHTQVLFDNQRAGYSMTGRLLDQGHRRIALLTYVEEILHPSLGGRLQGYEDALRDRDLPADPALVRRFGPGRDQAPFLSALLDQWLALPEPPTAVIAVDDILALEVIELLCDKNVRVPDEIAVVGFDNRAVARRFRPSFPTTNPDFERMGEVACAALLDAIEAGKQEPRTIILDVPLLLRQGAVSTALHTAAGELLGA